MEQIDPITDVKGVGSIVAKKFGLLGVSTVGDLIENYPRRYEDYSKVVSIAKLKPGVVTIKASIKQVTGRYVRRGMHITEAIASDPTGSVRLIWFNQPYRAAAIKKDPDYYIRGEFALKRQHLSIQNPSMELVSDFPLQAARIVPIYRQVKGLTSFTIQKAVFNSLSVIESLPETLPSWLLLSNGLISRPEAIKNIHLPESTSHLEAAKKRLGFEEVFQLTLAALLNRQELNSEHALKIPFDEEKAKQFVKHLPFTLTDEQKKAVWQIYIDMQREKPMNRLIEGDVGSGKTVVATMAAVMVINEGLQAILMAPTELLARQHAETIYNLLKPLGMEQYVCLLVGGMSPSQKRQAHENIKNGKALFIIGTHALFQDKVVMQQVGLIIIDEQHRFGVEQRKKLQAKAKYMPHVLSMTATPIPRSLALTLYGELDITLISTKPKNRKPVKTSVVSQAAVPKMYGDIEAEIEKGHQVFVVCPVISVSQTDLEDVETVYEQYKKLFKTHNVDILHGRMTSDQKEQVMKNFSKGKIDILVATTVVEVGVDVPNATVMVIHNADRFGLAQIHQLRGRVGRSSVQSHCYLLVTGSSLPSIRLRALETINDGFALAELDLRLRGPGAIYGVSQHGQLDLRVANLTDVKLISSARAAAQAFIDNNENLIQYPELNQAVSHLRTVTNLN